MRIIISGGGTGGHIYPAIAIADEIKALQPNAEILFVGARGRMEMEKVPKAGYPIRGLWISGLQRRLSLDNLSFPFKVMSSLWSARAILREFRPDVAVGVGGYASGPLLYAASWMGVPTLIQEQNSFAGITNQWLARRAAKICVAYPGMEKFFPADKILLTGNPVRRDILNLSGKREGAFAHFGLSPHKKTILAVGGSLGARSINESIAAALPRLIEQDVQLLWQTGKNAFVFPVEHEPLLQDARIKKTEFIYEMDLAYSLADVVISRAGALAVSELAIAAKPCVLVPFPAAAEDHQTQNARALVNRRAALMVRDAEARTALVQTTMDLLGDEPQRHALAQKIQQFARPEAVCSIAEEVIKLARK